MLICRLLINLPLAFILYRSTSSRSALLPSICQCLPLYCFILTYNKSRIISNHLTTHSLLYFWLTCQDVKVTVELQLLAVFWFKWHAAINSMMAEHCDPASLDIWIWNYILPALGILSCLVYPLFSFSQQTVLFSCWYRMRFDQHSCLLFNSMESR